MDSAESWALHIIQVYTSAEVHSIKGSPGDIADVGIFSDNADKTIFEFLEAFELGYIDLDISTGEIIVSAPANCLNIYLMT